MKLDKANWLGKRVWMGSPPECPDHGIPLEMEWQLAGRIMWTCQKCSKVVETEAEPDEGRGRGVVRS